jgi:glycosyltransferase involved in cell wall biosynthesis
MNMVYIGSIEHKFLSTLSHSLLSIWHASRSSADVILVVNAANGMFGIIPRLFRKPCVLNVDGMEWLRPKWNKVARFVFKSSAWLGTRFYHATVTDAEEMHRLYARDFGIDTEYIAYGAHIGQSERPDLLEEYGIEPQDYYLIASRLVPDNNADIIVRGFVESGSKRMLVIAGGADYRGNTVEQKFVAQLREMANDRVKFLGHVDSHEKIKELHCNCYAYCHGHQYGGINPSLLKALGFGNAILALDTPFNSEVLSDGKHGILFSHTSDGVKQAIQRLETEEGLAQRLRQTAQDRIRERFTWDQIAAEYIDLFKRVTDKKG